MGGWEANCFAFLHAQNDKQGGKERDEAQVVDNTAQSVCNLQKTTLGP